MAAIVMETGQKFNIGPMEKHIEAVFTARILNQTFYNLMDI